MGLLEHRETQEQLEDIEERLIKIEKGLGSLCSGAGRVVSVPDGMIVVADSKGRVAVFRQVKAPWGIDFVAEWTGSIMDTAERNGKAVGQLIKSDFGDDEICTAFANSLLDGATEEAPDGK